MTEASESGRPAPQEFEKVLTGATATVASFEEEKPTPLQRVQRFLHLYPTTVPFVVLLLGILLGLAVNPARFPTGSNLSTVLTQVTIIGILALALWSNRSDPILTQIVSKNAPVIIELPIAGLFAFVIVVFFQQTEAPVVVKFPGIELTGSSGEVFLWLLTFVGISLMIHLLWVP